MMILHCLVYQYVQAQADDDIHDSYRLMMTDRARKEPYTLSGNYMKAKPWFSLSFQEKFLNLLRIIPRTATTGEPLSVRD